MRSGLVRSHKSRGEFPVLRKGASRNPAKAPAFERSQGGPRWVAGEREAGAALARSLVGRGQEAGRHARRPRPRPSLVRSCRRNGGAARATPDEVWKFEDPSAGFGKIFQPTQDAAGFCVQLGGRVRSVPSDVVDLGQECGSRPRREADLQRLVSDSATNFSASASTSSRSKPLSSAISFSPRTSKERISRSAWAFR